MNFASIRFKLIIGGILVVLIPLAVSGYITVNNSTKTVTQLSKANAQAIAEGTAIQVFLTMFHVGWAICLMLSAMVLLPLPMAPIRF